MVGLGNPGERYRRTRHNAGFRAVDVLAARARASGRVDGDAWVAEAVLGGAPALLVRPPKGLEVGYVPIVTRQAASNQTSRFE